MFWMSMISDSVAADRPAIDAGGHRGAALAVHALDEDLAVLAQRDRGLAAQERQPPPGPHDGFPGPLRPDDLARLSRTDPAEHAAELPFRRREQHQHGVAGPVRGA